jgi:hypothetical protein
MTFRARSLIRLYPVYWRRRYADEVLAMIGDRGLSKREAADIVVSAAVERGRQASAQPFLASFAVAWMAWALGIALAGVFEPRRSAPWHLVLLMALFVSWHLLAFRADDRPDAIWKTRGLFAVAVALGGLQTWQGLGDPTVYGWPSVHWMATAGLAVMPAADAVRHSAYRRRILNHAWPPDAPKGWA